MKRAMRNVLGRQARATRPAAAVLVSIAAIAAAGCSADVARFDFPGFGLNGDGSTASIPRPTVPMRSGGSSLIDGDGSIASGRGSSGSSTGYVPPPRRADDDISMAALPDPQPTAPPPGAPRSAAAQPLAQSVPAQPPAPLATGETIQVQQGDTLYGLSKRHKVPVSELMRVNGLSTATIRPGQKLVLPGAPGPMKPGVRAAQPKAAPAPSPASAPARAANWDGSYTVKPGDSIYALSRQFKVSAAELQQVNGIADPLKVRPGTILKVPAAEGAATVAAAPSAQAPAPAPVAAPRVEDPSRPIASSTQPTIINGTKVAALNGRATDAGGDAGAASAPDAPRDREPAAPAAEPSKGEQTAAAGPTTVSTGKLRWPVRGKVIAGFGPRSDGTHNDGVNVAVPMGTEVHAAEAGIVAYAGSELKGYGNLVLLRHDNGWVTAYAHNEEILVKRGDRVKRGQVIGKAGKSGQVDQPQVHFELRQGAKPVDPTPFMEKL